jgi:hypothetical protein
VERPHVRFSGPVYESLPWLYLAFGVAALVASYLLQKIPFLSFIAALSGFMGIVSGTTILLRRRDYREMKEKYKGKAEGERQ